MSKQYIFVEAEDGELTLEELQRMVNRAAVWREAPDDAKVRARTTPRGKIKYIGVEWEAGSVRE